MDPLTLIAIILLILIVAGVLLGKITWDSGIRWIVLIAILGLLIYLIITYVGRG